MYDQDILDRFEELEAGRILGNLDADEIREWQKLSADPAFQGDLSLELMAAALEVESLRDDATDLSHELSKKIQGGISEHLTAEPEEVGLVHPARWQEFLANPRIAWAIAALFSILFIAQPFVEKAPIGKENSLVIAPEDSSPKENLDSLISKANDLITFEFRGTEEFRQMSGTVVWSDELQEGYMTLTNLPANDASAKQYQLWIVDPGRDEKPVDGGVFDISVTNGTAIIPIRNPLVVTNPQAFVITLEQPGGVVVSKQDTVVALAKIS